MMMQGAGTSRERGGPFLTVTVNHTEVQRKALPDQQALVIGRSLDCDVWIEDPVLSRHHCRVEPALEGDGFVVIDLESRNGTFVNGKRAAARQPLNDGDVITIGRTHIKFRKQGYCPPRPHSPEEALRMPANRAAMKTFGSPGTSQRPLPTPTPKPRGSIARANAETLSPGDTAAGAAKPGDTVAGAPAAATPRPLPFTRPPAKPMVKPVDES
jgi:pSer/pThr/pTyr-binding forkhead associated (FHA) protein